MAAMDFPASPTDGQVYQNYKYSTATGAWLANPVSQQVAVINPTAPSSPKAGDIWYNSDDGCTYVYYYDGDSYQWVASKNDATFSSTLGPRVDALEQGSINYVINGAMDIWQRGTSFSFTSNTPQYTADRWYCNSTFSAGSSSVTQQTFTPGSAPVAGYEGTYFMRMTAGSTASWMEFSQRIEDVRTASGTTVTLSFWAKASTTTTFTPMLRQNFGTSGSSNVDTAGSNVTLTTAWARYTATIVLPSITGKTINANNYLAVFLYASSPSSSQTIDLWGVQLNQGTVATAFHRNAPSIQAELAACQRYYQYSTLGQPAFTNGGVKTLTVTFTPPMRAIPTTSVAGIPGITANGGDQYHSKFYTASNPGENYSTSMTANAEL